MVVKIAQKTEISRVMFDELDVGDTFLRVYGGTTNIDRNQVWYRTFDSKAGKTKFNAINLQSADHELIDKDEFVMATDITITVDPVGN